MRSPRGARRARADRQWATDRSLLVDHAHTNRLIHETSPYLLQHAHNPVDWYPWGPEALERARSENKPILLSIGYSACHWCHVMERESFEDEAIAGLMNEHFVCIKVDREERPDLDHIYMSAVQMLTGHGGWPLTVFLTPTGAPFWGGTYFPPVDRQGMTGFPRVLAGISEAYRTKPGQIRDSIEQILAGLKESEQAATAGDIPADLLIGAARAVSRHYDERHGGIGDAPKFPNTMVFSLFLRAWHATREPRFLEMVVTTLRAMDAGGIHDQIGGGFHRYSVDSQWLVPHFEKMLYDNALLVRLYLEGYQATGDESFAQVARETLDYVLREMTHPNGGFYAAQDADSEGVEGKFFVWTPEEVAAAVAAADVELVCRLYDVTPGGNFEHKNILHRTLDTEPMARLFGRSVEAVAHAVAKARTALRTARSRRVPPARDEKILTSWNALMIGAFAEAAKVLGDVRYREAAERAVRFVHEQLYRDGRLLRTWTAGEAKLDAYLDDYAFLMNALLDVFEDVADPALLYEARDLGAAVVDRFEDREGGGFFFTASDHETLVHRPKPAFDSSIPSGNSAAVHGLLRLHHYLGEERFMTAAERALAVFGVGMSKNPFGFANMIAAMDFHRRKPREIVIVGGRDDRDVRALAARVHSTYVPNKTIAIADPDQRVVMPLAEGKTQIAGRATAYVCHRYTCSAPATTWEELEPLLEPARG
ncbi:MAG: thioredoxin domain-containing protein [Deltaproteobacteria bacterium]|nr:thioredoxin domain-containing protein [Deltaproteobacteria bacterium]